MMDYFAVFLAVALEYIALQDNLLVVTNASSGCWFKCSALNLKRRMLGQETANHQALKAFHQKQ
jgi:hypothetical protein